MTWAIRSLSATARASDKLALCRDMRAKTQMFFENAAIFGHVHVALAADEHQGAVGAKIAVPREHLLVRPACIVLSQMLRTEAGQIGSQAQIGFVRRLI